MFEFHEPGRLIDDDLELVLERTDPGDPKMDYAPTYHFLMHHIETRQEMGWIGLRISHTPYIVRYAGHIGYAVESAFRGHHYAARACRLLLPLARLHGLNPLWITCNPDNFASRRTCELAGADFYEIVATPQDSAIYLEGEHQKCRYRIDLP